MSKTAGTFTSAAIVPSPHRPANRVLLVLLIEARLRKRVVQIELAQRLGKPPSYVAKVELGERRLDVVEFVECLRA
jgi:hypothetical protein